MLYQPPQQKQLKNITICQGNGKRGSKIWGLSFMEIYFAIPVDYEGKKPQNIRVYNNKVQSQTTNTSQ